MTTDLAPGSTNGALPTSRLDVYAGGLVEDDARVDALALISCGYRGASQGDRPGLPRASRPDDAQQIHLHDPTGRAPGLKAALEKTGYRSLLIAFPLNDPREFVIQRFTRYSATRLEAYGDETQLTWIDATDKTKPQHRTFAAGTPEYQRLVATCKADTRIYFTLAAWTDHGPVVDFPDGLGIYALRTTSRHSVRSILGQLAYTARFTRGRLAGLPFELGVTYREVAGPDGTKRTIPVWTITTKPPEGARLSSQTFQALATEALQQGAALMLPAPDRQGWAEAEAAGPPPVEEPTEAELARLEAGDPPCDAAAWERAWFARVKDTPLEADAARAAFLLAYSEAHGPVATGSLAVYLEHATERQAGELLLAVGEELAARKRAADADRYARLFEAEQAAF